MVVHGLPMVAAVVRRRRGRPARDDVGAVVRRETTSDMSCPESLQHHERALLQTKRLVAARNKLSVWGVDSRVV